MMLAVLRRHLMFRFYFLTLGHVVVVCWQIVLGTLPEVAYPRLLCLSTARVLSVLAKKLGTPICAPCYLHNIVTLCHLRIVTLRIIPPLSLLPLVATAMILSSLDQFFGAAYVV